MEQTTDFIQLAKEAYKKLEGEEKELQAKLFEIQRQKGPLKNYMKSLGLIEIKKRKPRRKKVVEENT